MYQQSCPYCMTAIVQQFLLKRRRHHFLCTQLLYISFYVLIRNHIAEIQTVQRCFPLVHILQHGHKWTVISGSGSGSGSGLLNRRLLSCCYWALNPVYSRSAASWLTLCSDSNCTCDEDKGYFFFIMIRVCKLQGFPKLHLSRKMNDPQCKQINSLLQSVHCSFFYSFFLLQRYTRLFFII